MLLPIHEEWEYLLHNLVLLKSVADPGFEGGGRQSLKVLKAEVKGKFVYVFRPYFY